MRCSIRLVNGAFEGMLHVVQDLFSYELQHTFAEVFRRQQWQGISKADLEEAVLQLHFPENFKDAINLSQLGKAISRNGNNLDSHLLLLSQKNLVSQKW